MCFSAQASFLASGVLISLGSYALRKIKTKASKPLALIPFFFGIQQASEGVIWLTYTNPDYALFTSIAAALFLFFAFFFWPIWMPFTILCLEKKMARKHILYVLLGVGSTVAATLLYVLLLTGAQPEINCSHIYYNVGLPELFNYWGPFLYCIATIVPLFVSSKKHMAYLGTALCISVAATYWFYTGFFTSVWCFFAALLSAGIIVLL